jgi:tetratricopeptide (TPR) repeat protein
MIEKVQRGTWAAAIAMALGVLFWSAPVSAQDLGVTFQQGNQAFWSGDFDQAIERYEALVELGVWDADLFYNLGTTYARQGRFGPAILNLERASILEPGDEDIRHNLETTRRSLARRRNAEGQDADLKPPRSFWLNLLARVTSWQVGLPFLICWIGVFVVLGWRRMAKGEVIRLVLLILALVFGSLSLIGGALLLGKAAYDTQVHDAIAIHEGGAVTREGPGERFDRAFTASEGDRLRVIDREGDWLHLRDFGGHEGWGSLQDFGELRKPEGESRQ